MNVATLEQVELIVAERVAELERRLEGPRAFSVRQVAERLDLSMTRVREFISSGELRSFKVGGARRVDPQDLADFLADRRKRPIRVEREKAAPRRPTVTGRTWLESVRSELYG